MQLRTVATSSLGGWEGVAILSGFLHLLSLLHSIFIEFLKPRQVFVHGPNFVCILLNSTPANKWGQIIILFLKY